MTEIKELKPSSEIVRNALKPLSGQGFLGQKPKKSTSTFTLNELTTTVYEENKFDRPVETWNRNTLVHYYAYKHQTTFKVPFQINWQSDLGTIKKLFQFFGSHGLNELAHIKALIEWAFDNRDSISKSQAFHLRLLPKFVNDYLASTATSSESDSEWDVEFDQSTIIELKQLAAKGDRLEMFSQFGIPLVMTYLGKQNKLSPDKIFGRLTEIIKEAGKTPTEMQRVKRIVKHSIEFGPYPSAFLGLDWRDKLPMLANRFERETWWTDFDPCANDRSAYVDLISQKSI